MSTRTVNSTCSLWVWDSLKGLSARRELRFHGLLSFAYLLDRHYEASSKRTVVPMTLIYKRPTDQEEKFNSLRGRDLMVKKRR